MQQNRVPTSKMNSILTKYQFSVTCNQYHVVDHNSLLHMAFIDVILSQSISTQALSPYRMTKVSISKDFNVHYGILIYRPGLMPTKFVFSQ